MLSAEWLLNFVKAIYFFLLKLSKEMLNLAKQKLKAKL